jgi:hypothetical protein
MDRYRHCDVARIRRHRHELPVDRDPGDVETASRESVVLAHDAFTLGDPDARALAERVLYAIHTYHHFGVDFHPDDAGVLDDGGAFDDPDVLTEAFSVANTRALYSLLPDPAWSLGSFYTIEAFFPAVCRRILAALRRRGTAEDDLFYWALHGEVDIEHSAEWLEGIQRANLDDATHARIANGAVNHLLARAELFGALDQRVPVAVP